MNEQVVVVEREVMQWIEAPQLDALEVGKAHGYTYRVLPHKGTISEPLVTEEWVYHPREMETGPIPEIADQLAKPLMDTGMVVQQIIGHEVVEAEPETEIPLPVVAIGVVVVGMLAIVGIAIAIMALAALVMGAALLGAAVLIDPVLICVLEDGTWVQCASWVD